MLNIIADIPFPIAWFSSGFNAVNTTWVSTKDVQIDEKLIYAKALLIGLCIFLTWINSLTLNPNSKNVNAAIPIAMLVFSHHYIYH